ncbi:hypothetical protein [Pleomorphomonas sp. NRK KF1]|uniref:hypothetical protein n=1 Tax=Pleomorphomonas sp. NRK KF1 TaxID=2943000 RepID=UPI0020443E00|nr:hypothetical protein [Pleomorphomonas sp. NRK KF1]MCM5555722.1 hypothetical protein [Pleomorphomonas sp. NRK KF1]
MKKAFKAGLVDGFSAPFAFFVRKSLPVDTYQTTVGSAWREVGDAFERVMTTEEVGTRGEKRDTTAKRCSRAEEAA